ncbi:hypothetical protein GPECTOR_55g265 [Gonium pectorale]|uniref:Glycosyltransferase n=1 Tax=Gonium pectorale TaxID=33097 RepID=A0A150G651_GONPE|nr:hypothetical protein GPECTOR_55g265 [Gonium pectorale]|eukprot:KXZ45359.1 hypothetical protein GPECTOR_55g265 [Gonium pectorale]
MQRRGSTKQQASTASELTLANILVVLTWTQQAYDRCTELRHQYGHHCAVDSRHQQQDDGKHYFSAFWLAMGFYRVGAIVNAISQGLDTVFLDSDTVVLGDFLLLIQSLDGADVVTTTERCVVRNYSRPYDRNELTAWTANIGLTYFRAVPGTLRCGTSWMARMFHDVVISGRTWDQVAFNVVFPDCYRHFGLVWYGLDPRVFQLSCGQAGFKQCGCTFDDADVQAYESGGEAVRPERMSQKFVPFSSPGVCGPADWRLWHTKHYNCIIGVNGSSPQVVKAEYMRNLIKAAHSNTTGVIMPSR